MVAAVLSLTMDLVPAAVVGASGSRGSTSPDSEKLSASDARAFDHFGTFVVLGGNTLLVGAPGVAGDSGAVYAFSRHGGQWNQDQKLKPRESNPDDLFGNALAISGDVAIIGAPGVDSRSGAVYVFSRRAGVWMQQQRLAAADGLRDDEFGARAALSGDSLFIGAPGKNQDAGSVYVFERAGDSWVHSQTLTAKYPLSTDRFGQAIAMQGGTAIIGAPGGLSGGFAEVFERRSGIWDRVQSLEGDGPSYEFFGGSVALSGDTVAIGAETNLIGSAIVGSVTVFRRLGQSWIATQTLTPVDTSGARSFGGFVSFAGRTLVIGARGSQVGKGAVFVFERSGSSWIEGQILVADDGRSFDFFGGSVSSAPGIIAVGAAHYDGVGADSGAAYVFDLVPGP